MHLTDILQLALAIIGTLLMVICGYVGKSFNRLTESVQELNIKIAVVISQLGSHDERIKRLEEK